jgi:hypothetical protein
MAASWTTRLALCGILTAALGQHSQGSAPLTLKVSPTVSFAPATVFIRASIEADANNRSIVVTAESEEFYRSSEMPLDGDRAPRTNLFEFRSLPGGEYQVSAILFGANGERRALVRQLVSVKSGGGE